jgi:hypothetical protein
MADAAGVTGARRALAMSMSSPLFKLVIPSALFLARGICFSRAQKEQVPPLRRRVRSGSGRNDNLFTVAQELR